MNVNGERFLDHIGSLRRFEDDRGVLTVINPEDVPFEIKRIFWVRVPSDTARGQHYHKRCDQAIVCIDGTIHVQVDGFAEGRGCVLVSIQSYIVHIPRGHCVTYSNIGSRIATVLVLCSEEYDPEDVYECV